MSPAVNKFEKLIKNRDDSSQNLKNFDSPVKTSIIRQKYFQRDELNFGP